MKAKMLGISLFIFGMVLGAGTMTVAVALAWTAVWALALVVAVALFWSLAFGAAWNYASPNGTARASAEDMDEAKVREMVPDALENLAWALAFAAPLGGYAMLLGLAVSATASFFVGGLVFFAVVGGALVGFGLRLAQ